MGLSILYGVAGEGMGHAIRSAVVRDHLVSRGHRVGFACSKSRAARYLSRLGTVVSVPGLSTRMVGGKIQPLRTLLSNLPQVGLLSLQPLLWSRSLPRPDVVISDFEPVTARYAKISGIPLIAIDNIHFLSRCSHPVNLLDDCGSAAAALMYPVVSNMVPGAQHYMVTTFADARVLDEKTTLHLPILRSATFDRCQGDSGIVLVYFNEKADWASILNVLLACAPVRFRAYGAEPGFEGTYDNVTVVPMSDEFLRDLACASAVVGGAGFTLMTECIYAHKPLLALPFAGHFEQLLNANYLRAMMYGEWTDRLTPEVLRWFLSRVPMYAQRLANVEHDGNSQLFAALDGVLS